MKNNKKNLIPQKHYCLSLTGFLMVRPAGFEPAAYRLGGDRSIQLSYERTIIL